MADLNLLKPIVKNKAEQLLAECTNRGLPFIFTCTYRSAIEQDALYKQGRTKPGEIVTNAKGGQSLHQYGVAFDIVPIKSDGTINWNGDFEARAEIARSLGLEWGGDWDGFVDLPHFEYLAGYTLQDFQNGKIDESKFALFTEEQKIQIASQGIQVAQEAIKYPALRNIVLVLLQSIDNLFK